MEQNKMAVMPMKKLVFNMSLPLMLSLLIQSLYNIVDSIFVAKISENSLTATSLAFPMQLLMIAVGVGTSVGINAMLSRSIGAKDKNKTGNIATTGVLLALIATVVFMTFGFFGSSWFVNMFTDNVEIGNYCKQYLSICMIFCLGSFMATMYQRFLQAVGDTVGSMISLIAGAVTNLILDPILIFGLIGFPILGIRGAAIATVIGQWVSGMVAILLNKWKNPEVVPIWKGYHVDKDILAGIYKVGLPTIITQAVGSVMVTCMNMILMPFSTTAVAFFGIYYKLQSFLFMPMNGLGQAAIPIVGFNYGAKNYKRILEVIKTMIPVAVAIAMVMLFIFEIVPAKLLMLFHASEEMLQLGVPALRIIAISFPIASASMILGYAISGLGQGSVNMISTLIRQLVVYIPLSYLFARNFGIENAWFAIWIAEAIACSYAVLKSIKVLMKKEILKKEVLFTE